MPSLSAAGEKLAVVLTMDYLRREAAAGRREDFEKYLVAVLPGPPEPATNFEQKPRRYSTDCGSRAHTG